MVNFISGQTLSIDLQGIECWLSDYPEAVDKAYLEVRSIHCQRINPRAKIEGTKYAVPKRFRIGDLKKCPESANDYIREKAANGYNVYLERNPISRPIGRFSGDRDVIAVVSLALDIDGTLPQEALESLARLGLPPPTRTICSGNGSHLYWRIKPLSPGLGRVVLGRFVNHWQSHLPKSKGEGIDSVKHPSCELRLPGVNWKGYHDGSYEDYISHKSLAYVHSSADLEHRLGDLLPGLSSKEECDFYRVPVYVPGVSPTETDVAEM